MFDQFSYGYLGFAMGPDGRTLYYLTGGPIYIDGKRVTGKGKTAMGEAKGLEDLHVITYDTRNGAYRDNGAVFLGLHPGPRQARRQGDGRPDQDPDAEGRAKGVRGEGGDRMRDLIMD